MADQIAARLKVDPDWLATGFGQARSTPYNSQLTGFQVRQIRENLGMSPEELAAKIGIKAGTLQSVEKGDRSLGNAKSKVLQGLTRRFGQTAESKTRQLETALRLAITETYRIDTDESAMHAIRTLGASLEEDECTILVGLVMKKVLDPGDDQPAKDADDSQP
jgi:DNA-binding transcriptional regulator YiaG